MKTNYQKKLKKLQEAVENSRPDQHLSDSHIDYEYKGATKAKTVNKEFNQVIATLQRDTSGKFTKLAKRYKDIHIRYKEITEQRNQMNEDIREAVESLFPISDDIYTRVVETVSLTLKLAKAEPEHEKSTLNTTTYIKELESLLGMADDKLNLLRDKHTKITKVAAKSAKVLEPKLKESIGDNLVQKIKEWCNRFSNKMNNWLRSWEKDLEELERRIDEGYYGSN